MQSTIPSAAEVRARLESLSAADLEALAGRVSVPVTTLIKVRNGQTANPRLETVRAIWSELLGTRRRPRGARRGEGLSDAPIHGRPFRGG